jgi:ubiquinone/menaquinone biosynthesis C-methylase UbiE
MSEPIRFQNGAQYDEFMGQWSRLAGDRFLQWLAPPRGVAWADIGCGNGAFTQLIVEGFAPSSVEGIDPSPGQIEFARGSPAAKLAHFQQGDSMALPYASGSIDIAVMALVLFFVPDPAQGVQEMVRVVRPGGQIAAYTWDILEGGFPYEPVFAALLGQGMAPALPPSSEVSRMATTLQLWAAMGLTEIDSTVIEVHRTFETFEEYWRLAEFAPGLSTKLAEAPPDKAKLLQDDVRRRLQSTGEGPFTVRARANAVRGRVAA